MDINLSYNITNQNQEHQYDFIYHKEYSPQENAQDVIKMECDPAYGAIQDCNKEYSPQEDAQDIIKMESDPAYGGIQDGNSVVNNLPDLAYNDASIYPNLSNLETIKSYGDEDEDQHSYVITVQGADYLQLIGSATKSSCDVASDINVSNQCQSLQCLDSNPASTQ